MMGQFQAFFVLLFSFAAIKLGFLRVQESLTIRSVGQKITGFLIMALGMWIALK